MTNPNLTSVRDRTYLHSVTPTDLSFCYVWAQTHYVLNPVKHVLRLKWPRIYSPFLFRRPAPLL